MNVWHPHAIIIVINMYNHTYSTSLWSPSCVNFTFFSVHPSFNSIFSIKFICLWSLYSLSSSYELYYYINIVATAITVDKKLMNPVLLLVRNIFINMELTKIINDFFTSILLLLIYYSHCFRQWSLILTKFQHDIWKRPVSVIMIL